MQNFQGQERQVLIQKSALMGIKRKIFEFIKYYKVTESSSAFVVYHCMWRGRKDFPITLMALDTFGS